MGSAASLVDDRLVANIEKTDAEFEGQKLNHPRRFSMKASNLDGTDTVITCDRAVMFDTQLRIRNGSALVLRDLHWLVP